MLLLRLASSKSFLILSWSLFGSMLSSNNDIPNLKNLDFSYDIHRFLKNQGFRYEDGLESVLGLSWAPLGCSWVSLGTTFGPPDRPKRAETLWPLRSLGSLGSLFLALVSFFSLLLGLASSKSFLIPSWSLFGSILSSQDDLPNLKNLDFS